ncbi:four helix bundle protein [Alkaliphilus pronyensis]|uniref:Four helix bundle protein n=1 Tax=Alkaliphilus pronyensis TaxID=1482732 RepID=A0A6I0F1B4_9FIRM|nr:four helix bundle protein [Alkaliphilus pronyensis]KAB3534752.1 four helix bundle protein [Alkaliphilus pronyensis]
MGDNNLRKKAYQFALSIVDFYKLMQNEQREFVISKQLLRSGTSIGANIEEAQYAQSRKDFIHKLSISLKEASETKYWLRLINDSYQLDNIKIVQLLQDCEELICILVSIVKKSKFNSDT